MRKVIYRFSYDVLLTLTNRFKSRSLSRYKIFIGTALLVLLSGCHKKEIEEVEDESSLCYAPPEPPQESVISASDRSSLQNVNQIAFSDPIYDVVFK